VLWKISSWKILADIVPSLKNLILEIYSVIHHVKKQTRACSLLKKVDYVQNFLPFR
jgi:hypothetical protein